MNNKYKKMQELFITLNNVDKELNYNCNNIKTLTENNDFLSLRTSFLEKKIEKMMLKLEIYDKKTNY